MIDPQTLDSVKLVNAENLASPQDTSAIIERAVIQGSQAWGVTREDAVILRLASELRAAQLVADGADEAQRALKGAQLASGRLKKRITVLEGQEIALARRAAEQSAEIILLKEQRDETKLIAEGYLTRAVDAEARLDTASSAAEPASRVERHPPRP